MVSHDDPQAAQDGSQRKLAQALASGLLQALEQVAGRQTLCMAVDFPEGHSTEALGQRLAAACAHCDDGDGVVFLSDMLGGSPFREAANIALAHPGYEVIAGTNLQMAVEMMLDRPQLDTEAFRARVAHRIGNLDKKGSGRPIPRGVVLTATDNPPGAAVEAVGRVSTPAAAPRSHRDARTPQSRGNIVEREQGSA